MSLRNGLGKIATSTATGNKDILGSVQIGISNNLEPSRVIRIGVHRQSTVERVLAAMVMKSSSVGSTTNR